MSKTPEKITIAVVTYHEDFNLLKRFLDSVFAFWKKEQLDCIKVIFNDTIFYKKEFKDIITPYLNREIPVHVHYSDDLYPEMYKHDWCSQQFYKLIISEYIEQEWYIIHDCKDYYVEDVCIEDIFTSNGRATMQLDYTRKPGLQKELASPVSIWTPGPFMFAFEQTCDMFGVDHRDYKSWHLPTTTPFLAKTDVVKDLVNEMTTKLGKLFPMMFSFHTDGQLVATEFLLYNAYVTSKDLLNKLYCDWFVNHKQYFNKIKQSKDLRITGNQHRVS